MMLTARFLLLSFSLVLRGSEQIPQQGGICYHCEHFPRWGIFHPRCLLKKASASMYCRDTNVYCISISYQGANVGDFYGGAVKCTTQSTKITYVLPQELCTLIQIQTKENAILVQKCITFCIGQGCSFLEYLQGGTIPLWKWRQMRLVDLLSRELASPDKQELDKSRWRSRRSANIDNVTLFSQEAAASVTQDSSALLNWTKQSVKEISQTSGANTKPCTLTEQNSQIVYSFFAIPVASSLQSLIPDTSHEPLLHVAHSEIVDGFDHATSQLGSIGAGQYPGLEPSADLPTAHVFEVIENAASVDFKNLRMSTKPLLQMCRKDSQQSTSVGVMGGVSIPSETHLSPSFSQQNMVTFSVKTPSAFDESQTVRYSWQGNGNVPDVSSHMHDLSRTTALEVATNVMSSSAFCFTEYSARTDSLIITSLSPVKMIPLSVLLKSVNTYTDTNFVTVSNSKMTLQPFDQAQDGLIPNAAPHMEKLSTKLTGFLHVFTTQSMQVEHLSSFFTDEPGLIGTMTADSYRSFVDAFGSRGIHLRSDGTELSASGFAPAVVSESFQTAEESGTVRHHTNNGNPSGDGAHSMENLSIIELQSVSAYLVNNEDQLLHSSHLHSVALGTLIHHSKIQSQRGRMLLKAALGTPDTIAESHLLVSECVIVESLQAGEVVPQSSDRLQPLGSVTEMVTARWQPVSTGGFETSPVNNQLMALSRHILQKERWEQEEHFKTSISDDLHHFFASNGVLYSQETNTKQMDFTEVLHASVVTDVTTFQSPYTALGDLPTTQWFNRTSSDLVRKINFNVHSMLSTTQFESSTASMVDLLTSLYSDTYLISNYLQLNAFPAVSGVSSEAIQPLSWTMPLFNIFTIISLLEGSDTVSHSIEKHTPNINNVESSSARADEFPLYVTQPPEINSQAEVNPSFLPGYFWNDGYQRVSSKISNLGTFGSVIKASFLLEPNGLNTVLVSSPGMLPQEMRSYANSALTSPKFRTVLPSMNMINFAMLPSLILASSVSTSSAFQFDVLFNSRLISTKVQSTKASLDFEYLEANEVIVLIPSTSIPDANANQPSAILGGENVLISQFDSSTKQSSQDIRNTDLSTSLSFGYASLSAMKSFFQMMHTLEAKDSFGLPVETIVFSPFSNLPRSTAQTSVHSSNSEVSPFTAESGNNISLLNGSSLKLQSSIIHTDRDIALTSLNIINSGLQSSFIEHTVQKEAIQPIVSAPTHPSLFLDDKRIPFQSSSVLLWKTPSSFTFDHFEHKKELLESAIFPSHGPGSLTRSTDSADVIAFPGVSLELEVTAPPLHIVSSHKRPLLDKKNTTTHLDLEYFSADGPASLVRPADLVQTSVVSIKPKMFPALIKSHLHPTYSSVAEEDTKPLPPTSMAFSSLDVTTQPERVFVQTGDKSLPSAQLESHSVLSLLGACSPSLQLPDFTQDDTSPIWFLHSLPPGNLARWYDMSIEGTSTTMQVAFPMSHDLHTPAFSELELLPLHVPSSASSHSYGRDLDGFGKVSSKMKTIFSLRKMAAPAEHPSSYHGDSTLPTFTIKSEFVLPSKDITHLASGSWVSLSPQQETSALEPEGILCHESTIQHSHLGFDNFRLLSESLSSNIFHLGNEDLTKVLMMASKEATCSTLLSSIYLNAYGDPSIALHSEASFLLTDEFGIRSVNKLNTGCFFTLIKRTPCTSLDVIGSEDFSSSIADLALQSTNSLEAHNTVVINNHVLADVSNALMETMNISSTFVDMHFVTQSPVVIKSDAMLSEYFALSEVHTSWFLDVSNLVKSSVHLLTPELFSTSVSGSVALSPTRPMTVPLSGLYGDSFIPETLPKLYPESLWHSKLTSQQSELDSHALGIQISDALVPVTVSSGMCSYFSTNIFLSVIGILALGSSAFVTRSAVDMILPFPLSQPSDVKMTMSTDTGSVSRDPKLTEVFTKPTIALGSNHDTGGSEFHFSRTLRENLPSIKFRTAVATRENILDAVVMISKPGLFLPVESSVPITAVPTISEPNLLPISHLDAKTYIVGSKSKQTPKETLLISTLLPPSSQILEQFIASLTDFSSIAINALLPLEGSSWANLPALSVLSKVTCTEFDTILSEDPSFVPTATLPSSSTPPFISIIEPSLPATTFVLRLNTILSSTHSVPPSAMWEMLKPTLEVTSHPTDVAPQNPTFPVSSPRPISSSERNGIMIALIKEENLLEVMLQVNRSIPIFEESFWQMISKALKETYIQALPSTGESNKTRRRGDSSENIQVVVESVRRQTPDVIVVQFVVLSNGQLLKASDVAVTFKRLANTIHILSGKLPYQVVKVPCPVASPLPQPPTHNGVGWMVAVYALVSFCLALLALFFYCMKKGWKNGEDITVSQQGTFRRERAEASDVIHLQEREQRVDDIEMGLLEGRSPPKASVTTLA